MLCSDWLVFSTSAPAVDPERGGELTGRKREVGVLAAPGSAQKATAPHNTALSHSPLPPASVSDTIVNPQHHTLIGYENTDGDKKIF